jgi:hypothetical protein
LGFFEKKINIWILRKVDLFMETTDAEKFLGVTKKLVFKMLINFAFIVILVVSISTFVEGKWQLPPFDLLLKIAIATTFFTTRVRAVKRNVKKELLAELVWTFAASYFIYLFWPLLDQKIPILKNIPNYWNIFMTKSIITIFQYAIDFKRTKILFSKSFKPKTET